jgi:hypothetical protein
MVGQQHGQRREGRTHFKNFKDSVEVRPPRSNRVFIAVRKENTGDKIALAQLDDAPPDLRYGPTIEGAVSELGT